MSTEDLHVHEARPPVRCEHHYFSDGLRYRAISYMGTASYMVREFQVYRMYRCARCLACHADYVTSLYTAEENIAPEESFTREERAALGFWEACGAEE